MDSTRGSYEHQEADDQDYPVSPAFYPEHLWRRAAPRRPHSCPRVGAAPFGRDQELDGLRQELVGWKSTAAYWQAQCARLEMENRQLQRVLDSRKGKRVQATPPPFRGVEDS
jgi:hypothetical protein